jgi:hypothetical protein
MYTIFSVYVYISAWILEFPSKIIFPKPINQKFSFKNQILEVNFL